MNKNSKIALIAVVALVFVLLVLAGCSTLLPGTSLTRQDRGETYYNSPRYSQGGMMGRGHIGGSWGGYAPGSEQITIDEAAESVERYLRQYGEGLELVEIMEFERNFYAEVEEESTGIHAMELLVDKYTGRVFPEMGPNMMWNTKYGMHNYSGADSTSNAMSISPERAQRFAQRYLDKNLPGLTVEEAETFYGYYTMHTVKDGEIEGMLSVNGYNGSVWYHSWHGPFIAMAEYHKEYES